MLTLQVDGQRSVRLRSNLHQRRTGAREVTEYELAVLIAAGERAGIAIHAENRSGNFSAFLSNHQLPGLFVVLPAGYALQVPETGDIRSFDLRFGLRHGTDCVDWQWSAAPRAIFAVQDAVLHEIGRAHV